MPALRSLRQLEAIVVISARIERVAVLRDLRRRIAVDVAFHVDVYLEVGGLTNFTLTVHVGTN